MNKKIAGLKSKLNKDADGSSKQDADSRALRTAKLERANEAAKHSKAHHNKAHRKA